MQACSRTSIAVTMRWTAHESIYCGLLAAWRRPEAAFPLVRVGAGQNPAYRSTRHHFSSTRLGAATRHAFGCRSFLLESRRFRSSGGLVMA